MGTKTNIPWCDSTINFWSGCTKVSAGCANCYAEALSALFDSKQGKTGADHSLGKWGPGAPRRWHEASAKMALKLNRKPWVCGGCGAAGTLWPPSGDGSGGVSCVKCGGEMHRRRVFSLSLGDWLDPEVPIDWLARMLNTVRLCADVEWILCTKRPDQWYPQLAAVANAITGDMDGWLCGWLRGTPPSNVTILATVENQEQADNRIPHLLRIPAARRGLSLEPLLGPVDLSKWLCDNSIHENEHPNGAASAESYQIGRARNRFTGEDMAREKARLEQVEETNCDKAVQKSESGKRDGAGVFASSSDDEQNTCSCWGTPCDLEVFQRGNTNRNDDQSQEWNKKRQQTRESGTSNLQPAGYSLHEGFGKQPKVSKSRRAEESRSQDNERTGRSNPEGILREQQHNASDVGNEIRPIVSGYQSNSARRQVENYQRQDGGLHKSQKLSEHKEFQRAIHLLIIGGESGPKARPCNVEWIRSLVKQGQAVGVPVFVKQLGANPTFTGNAIATEAAEYPLTAIKHPKGADPSEWSEDLRKQQWPETI